MVEDLAGAHERGLVGILVLGELHDGRAADHSGEVAGEEGLLGDVYEGLAGAAGCPTLFKTTVGAPGVPALLTLDSRFALS